MIIYKGDTTMAMENPTTIQLQGPLEIENVQIPFEDDDLFFNTDKEINQIIDVTSTVTDLTKELTNDKLCVKGVQKISIIFLEEDKAGDYERAHTEKPFESYIDVWSNCVEPIEVAAGVTHCQVFVNDQGRISGSGSVNLQIKKILQQEIPETILISESIQTKERRISTVKRCGQELSHFVIREGIELPEDIAPIGEIIKSTMKVDLQQFSITNDKVYVEGDLILKVLYQPQESTNNSLEYYVNEHIPFNSLVKLEEEPCEEKLLVKLAVIDYLTEARPDFRGENRFIQFQVNVNVDVIEEKTETYTLIEDLYDINDPKLMVDIDNVTYVADKQMIQTAAECVETLHLSEEMNDIARILDVTISLGVIRMESNNHYQAKQCGSINVLYIDDVGKIQAVQQDIICEIESEESPEASLYNTFEATVSGITYRATQAQEIQVQFTLNHEVEAYYNDTCSVVVDVFSEEYEAPKAGLYVCFTKQKDIWEIAKKYRVKENDVRLVDEESEDQKRVIISKKMY